MKQRSFFIVMDLDNQENKMHKYRYCKVTDGIEVWDQYVSEDNIELQKFDDDRHRYRELHKDLYVTAGVKFKKIIGCSENEREYSGEFQLCR